jgi:hypothetical protein
LLGASPTAAGSHHGGIAGQAAKVSLTTEVQGILPIANGGSGGSTGYAPAGTALALTGSATGGTKTAAWTAKELIAETSLGGIAYKGASLTLNFNGAGTGAGGMDTGAMPTAADLSIYAIYNPTTNTWNTLGCAGSTSNGPIYGGAHMPAGYAASALIWTGVTNGGNFIGFFQVGRHIDFTATTVLSGGTSTSAASVSLAACVPANAILVGGNLQATGTITGVQLGAIAALTLGNKLFSQESAPWENMPMVTAQTLWYVTTGGAPSVTISCGNYNF